MNPNVLWTPDMDKFLMEHYSVEGVDWVALKLSTNSKCVRRRATTLRKLFDQGVIDINVDKLYSKEGVKSAHPSIQGKQPQSPFV